MTIFQYLAGVLLIFDIFGRIFILVANICILLYNKGTMKNYFRR